MIVAITGATGFIGRRLAEHHLKRNDEVRYLTRTNHKPIEGAKPFLADVNSFKEKLLPFLEGVDVLYHCAGELEDENVMYATHVDGTQNLLNILKELHINNKKIFHWIQLSSCGAYGQQVSNLGERYVDEETSNNPTGLYECTKTEADQLVIEFSVKNDWFKWSVLRPTIVFGLGMKSTAIIRIANLIKKRLFFYVGDKNAVANYVHVDDVVNAMTLSVNNENAYNQTFIISNDCKLHEVINSMAEALSRPIPKWVINAFLLKIFVYLAGRCINLKISDQQVNVMMRKTYYSNNKVKRLLKWNPLFPVPTEIKKYINKTINKND